MAELYRYQDLDPEYFNWDLLGNQFTLAPLIFFPRRTDLHSGPSRDTGTWDFGRLTC